MIRFIHVPALLTALFVSGAPAAHAGLCKLDDLCPDLDAEKICAASEGECLENYWAVCVSSCISNALNAPVEPCLADCENDYVACGTRVYSEGASCYPCYFEPDRCNDRCVRPDLPFEPFEERWTGTPEGAYVPNGSGVPIEGEEGAWLLEDVVSTDLVCGPTPHRAEVGTIAGSPALRLSSVESERCFDDVWVTLGRGFSSSGDEMRIPFDQGTEISFREHGHLEMPAAQFGFCRFPPCIYDSISLVLTDNRSNSLAYVFQRAPEATPSTHDPFTREIFIDETRGSPPRNLFEDFSGIPEFDASHDCGFWITSITFAVDEHGEGVIDDLCIANSGCSPIVIPEPQALPLGLGAVAAIALLRRRRLAR